MSRLPQRPVAPPSQQNLPQAPMTNWPSAPRGNWPPAQSRSKAGGVSIPLWVWLTVGGAVIGLALLVTLGVVIAGAVSDKVETDRAMRDIEQTADEFHARHRNDEIPTAELGSEFDRYVGTVEQKGANLNGPEGIMLRASTTIMRRMQPQVDAYTAAMVKLETANGLDPTTINSKTDIDRLLGLVKTFREASTQLRKRFEKLPDDFAAELRTQKVAESNIRAALSGFRTSSQIDLSLKAQDEDLVCCDLMTKIFSLLKKDWGMWSHEGDGIAFERDASADQFNSLMTDLEACIMRQESLRQQLLTRQQTGLRGR